MAAVSPLAVDHRPFAEVDAAELAEACCADAIDRRIVRLLLAGHKKEDLPQFFRSGRRDVWRRLLRIACRLGNLL